ncbi:MAG: hypothetical protein E2P02_12625 [Acidobacteria bacterium]|nr:MAG: hypothetical protein E2P02_12625 [Acidobacteriota bacterium]
MGRTTTPIEEYKRIRLLWPDHLGLARGKYLPTRTKATSTGHSIAVFALGFDRSLTAHEGAYFYEGTPDLEVRFEPEEVRPGWEPATGLVIPDVFKDGEPLMMAPRNVLKKAIEDWDKLGYEPKVGLELEAFLMKRREDGGYGPIDTPGAYVYGTGSAVDPDGVLDELMETCETIGLKLESVHSEYDNGQFELTLNMTTRSRRAMTRSCSKSSPRRSRRAAASCARSSGNPSPSAAGAAPMSISASRRPARTRSTTKQPMTVSRPSLVTSSAG